MQGNFSYHNPTKLYFGDESLNYLMRYLVTLLLIISTLNGWAQNTSFARGADVSWCTEMEADNVRFCNKEGVETDIFALMKQIGMTAIRLRVWVNPAAYGYGAWCDKIDVVAKAKRAYAQGLDLMIDFHYSDFFTDPGTQNTPLDWKDYSLEQMKAAVAEHTKDVLQALKDEGITPKWVQVGNETSNGMIWPKGKIDWDKSGSARYYDYVALSNAGYYAVKDVFPNAYVIVHHDNAYQNLAWFYREFKNAGGKFDMIGLSHYPDYDNWNSTQNDVASNPNAANSVKSLGQTFNVPVMIVETGFRNYNATRARNVMQDLFDRMMAISQCAGIFYWEPQVNGTWKPQYYNKLGWGAYGMGAFSTYQTMYRPTEALDAFKDPNPSGIVAPTACASKSNVYYDLQGRRVSPSTKGLYVCNGTKVVVK